METSPSVDTADPETRLRAVERAVSEIQNRNAKVESDKAWEVSGARRFFISLVTYVVTALVFYHLRAEHFMLSAVVPTLGYYLSTLSLPFVKRWWTARRSLTKSRGGSSPG